MKTGLKPRLIFAFASIIILPILVTVLFLSLFTTGIDERSNQGEDELDVLFTDVKRTVEIHTGALDQPNDFYEKIKPLLKKYDIELKLFSSEGEILFESADHEKSKSASIWPERLRKLEVEVPTEERGDLSAEIKAKSFSVPPFEGFKDILLAVLLAIVAGLAVLTALILLWTWYISRTILQPLKEIYKATEEVIEGNLDYKIPYDRQDEIGTFINGFNLMRGHLKKSIEHQRQYERARKQLIASISHDLRTPLASIKGYVEGLEDGVAKDLEMQKKYLGVIKSKTSQLDRLIDDLFEFSKFELEQLSIDKKLVNSREFFLEAFRDAEMEYRQEGIELLLEEPIPSVSLNIDSGRIKQVMANLFDNAVKYGGTKIHVNVVSRGSQLQISMKDNGPGIEGEDLPYIFQAFYRGEKSRSRESGGTGLGLAIVKYIVNAHRGEISVTSRPGKGSEFTFTLPQYVHEEVEEAPFRFKS